jgi:hypothetical protein
MRSRIEDGRSKIKNRAALSSSTIHDLRSSISHEEFAFEVRAVARTGDRSGGRGKEVAHAGGEFGKTGES